MQLGTIEIRLQNMHFSLQLVGFLSSIVYNMYILNTSLPLSYLFFNILFHCSYTYLYALLPNYSAGNFKSLL